LTLVHSRLGPLPLGSLLSTGLSPGRALQTVPPVVGAAPRTGVTEGLSTGQAPQPPLMTPQTPTHPIRPRIGQALSLRVHLAALPRTSLRLGLEHRLLLQPPTPLMVGPPPPPVGPKALLRTPLLLKLPCQLHPQASQLEAFQHLAHLAGLLPRPWQVLQPLLRIPPLPTQPSRLSSGQERLLKVAPPANLLVVSLSLRTMLLVPLSLEPLEAFLHPCPAVVAQLWLTQPLKFHPQHQRLLQLAQTAAP